MNSTIDVKEIFVSIQGEGIDVGSVCVFVRTAGCSLTCRYCDTAYARTGGKLLGIDYIVRNIASRRIPYVTVTGGEPLEQENISDLLNALNSLGCINSINVETSGYFYREDVDFDKVKLTLSPKPPSMMDGFPWENVVRYRESLEKVDVKFPVLTPEDVSFVKDFVYRNAWAFDVVIFQPIYVEGIAYPEVVRRVIDYILTDKDFINDFTVRVIPQVHRLVGVK